MNISIKMRLILLGTILAFVPALVISILIKNTAINDASVIVTKGAENKLIALRDVTSSELHSYYELIDHQILTFSHSLMVIEAMGHFAPSFHRYARQIQGQELEKEKANLKDFYINQFDAKYKSLNGNESASPEKLLEQAGQEAWALQYLFISNNPNPLGEKDKLAKTELRNTYTRYHGKFHPPIREYLKSFGYYDIFLVDLEGSVVYSVYKELDYATSLIDGPYANSGLADAYRHAAETKEENAVYFTDYAPYTPSYGVAASFVSTPIYNKGEKTGVLIFQIPSERVNNILNYHNEWRSTGLGETGQTFVVGQDKTLRNNSRGLIENKEKYLADMKAAGMPNSTLNEIDKTNSAIGLHVVNTDGVTKALQGQAGSGIFNNSKGKQVLSAYKPFTYKQLNWAIMSEVETDEAFADIGTLSSTLFQHIVFLVSVFLVVGAILGLILANLIIRPINNVISTIYDIAEGEGDLTQRLKVKGKDETAKLSKGINLFINHIDTTFSSILDSVVRLIPISQDMAEVNNTISAASNEQKRHSEKINSLLIDTNESTLMVDERLGQINEATVSGNRVVESSSKTVEGVNQTMSTLSENILRAVSAIDTLTKDTDRISGIIDVINGIAEQTNLLALNAAIEAARAGEAGRGFAVVADEVRTLASKTRQSTDEVTEMVNTIQSSTKSVVTLMNDSQKNADNSSENVNQATKELSLVKEAMEIISQRVADIAGAIQQQQHGFTEINQTYEQMTISFKESQISGEKSNQVGNDIAKLGDTIMNKIAHFKVTDDNWSTARRSMIRDNSAPKDSGKTPAKEADKNIEKAKVEKPKDEKTKDEKEVKKEKAVESTKPKETDKSKEEKPIKDEKVSKDEKPKKEQAKKEEHPKAEKTVKEEKQTKETKEKKTETEEDDVED